MINKKEAKKGEGKKWSLFESKDINLFMKTVKFSDDEPGDSPVSSISHSSDDSLWFLLCDIGSLAKSVQNMIEFIWLAQ